MRTRTKTKTAKLYVTEWAPNGTNDLLIVVDGEIKHCIDEATFGIDVCKAKPCERATSVMGDIYPGHDWVESNLMLRRITIKDLRTKLAVSPVDADGSHLIERLKRAGVRL